MRTSKAKTMQRADFVIKLYAGDSEMSISEVRRRLEKKYKQSMSYALITKYRDAVKAQRALTGPVVVATSTAKLPNGQPVVSVLSPASGLPSEFVEGLKHLVRHQLYQSASSGVIQIAAAKDGEISVSCKLEEKSATQM
jgi:hypothetical protein